MSTATDTNGDLVKPSDKIKLLSINPLILEALDEDEKKRVMSMIGEIFEVISISEGYPKIEMVWDLGNGLSESQSFTLQKHEMQLVKKRGSGGI